MNPTFPASGLALCSTGEGSHRNDAARATSAHTRASSRWSDATHPWRSSFERSSQGARAIDATSAVRRATFSGFGPLYRVGSNPHARSAAAGYASTTRSSTRSTASPPRFRATDERIAAQRIAVTAILSEDTDSAFCPPSRTTRSVSRKRSVSRSGPGHLRSSRQCAIASTNASGHPKGASMAARSADRHRSTSVSPRVLVRRSPRHGPHRPSR